MSAASLVDASFRWDGTSSDLAMQYYRLYLKNVFVEKRLYASLPAAIQQRLDEVGTTFDKLPGLLQRALVWDSGYVENGDRASDLVRVLTLNGVSMAEIAVPREDYVNVVQCKNQTCTQPDGDTWYKNADCTSADMVKASRCAVQDAFETRGDPISAIWSTGGLDTAVPAMRLLMHDWLGTDNVRNRIAAIHTAEQAFEPKYAECARNANDKTTPGFGSLVIACAIDAASAINTRGPMSAPKPGKIVTAWLKEFAPTPTPAPTQSDEGVNLITIIAPAVAVVLLAVVVVLLYCRRRAKSRSEADGGLTPSVECYERSMHSPFPVGMTPVKAGTCPSVATRTISIGASATRPSSFDETNESPYQEILRTLLGDPTVADRQIDHDKIEFAEQVSKGAYGEVWVGYWNDEIVALKRLLRSKHQAPHDIRAFAQEIQLSARLHHPNIVRFIGVSWNGPEDLCMVMEILPAGDLAKVLRENGSQLSWRQHKLGMARGLASAISYLHAQSPAVIHRDLKSKNVLLTNTLEPKVIDFGVSRRKMDDTMTAGVGTPYWTAPEVLEGLRYTEKSDIYSFGVLLTELDTCQIPYFDVKNELGGMIHLKILNEVVSGKLRPSVTPSCPTEIREVIDACLRQDPTTRPTAAEVLWMLA